jgi:hypothetical protein
VRRRSGSEVGWHIGDESSRRGTHCRPVGVACWGGACVVGQERRALGRRPSESWEEDDEGGGTETTKREARDLCEIG